MKSPIITVRKKFIQHALWNGTVYIGQICSHANFEVDGIQARRLVYQSVENHRGYRSEKKTRYSVA